MVTHYRVILWHNIIGRLLKPSLLSGILPPYCSWDLDTNLLHTCGNSAANLRSHIVPGKSTYQSGMSDFRDIVEFRASAAVWFESLSAGRAHLQARGQNFKLQLQIFFIESNLCKTWILAHFKTKL